MESAIEYEKQTSMQCRKKALEQWLTEINVRFTDLRPMVGDASFRRYFRLYHHHQSYVVMDAPPPQENTIPFIAIANALREIGVQTPHILNANTQQGFILLTDFGDATYLKILNIQNADLLYKRALDSLAIIQTCRNIKNHCLPSFSADWMWKEWTWHKDWVLKQFLNLSLDPETENQLDSCYDILVQSAIAQPQVFMHRDYHSANLMLLDSEYMTDDERACNAAEDSSAKSVGVLDFQDAFIGPITYDLVSLLRDCYIDWPNESLIGWVEYYFQRLSKSDLLNPINLQTFIRWFDLMGIQRHLKALFTFARKHIRDQQSQYLHHMPRTLNYLLNITAQYPELSFLHEYLKNILQPSLMTQLETLRCVP